MGSGIMRKQQIRGTSDCMTTTEGDPTMIATIHDWVVAMQKPRFKQLPELPELVHSEAAVFEKELWEVTL